MRQHVKVCGFTAIIYTCFVFIHANQNVIAPANQDVIQTDFCPSIWDGIPDQVIGTGKIFQYKIPERAFRMSENAIIKISTSSQNSSLPEWISYNQESRELLAVPTIQDEYGIYLKATLEDPKSNSNCAQIFDVFHISVTSWSSDVKKDKQATPGSDGSKTSKTCYRGVDLIQTTLIFAINLKELWAVDRLNLIKNLAHFLGIDSSVITISTGNELFSTQDNFKSYSILASGHGNTVAIVPNATELTWQVPCNVFPEMHLFVKVLQHNVEGGRLTSEVGHNVVGWYISALVNPSKQQLNRKKRLAHRFMTPVPTPVPDIVPATKVKPTSTSTKDWWWWPDTKEDTLTKTSSSLERTTTESTYTDKMTKPFPEQSEILAHTLTPSSHSSRILPTKSSYFTSSSSSSSPPSVETTTKITESKLPYSSLDETSSSYHIESVFSSESLSSSVSSSRVKTSQISVPEKSYSSTDYYTKSHIDTSSTSPTTPEQSRSYTELDGISGSGDSTYTDEDSVPVIETTALPSTETTQPFISFITPSSPIRTPDTEEDPHSVTDLPHAGSGSGSGSDDEQTSVSIQPSTHTSSNSVFVPTPSLSSVIDSTETNIFYFEETASKSTSKGISSSIYIPSQDADLLTSSTSSSWKIWITKDPYASKNNEGRWTSEIKESSSNVWSSKDTESSTHVWTSKDTKPSTHVWSSKKEHSTDVWHTKDTEPYTDVWYSKKEHSTHAWSSKDTESSTHVWTSKDTKPSTHVWSSKKEHSTDVWHIKDTEPSTDVWYSKKEHSTHAWSSKDTESSSHVWTSKDTKPSTHVWSSKKEHSTDVWHTKDTEPSTDVWYSKKEHSTHALSSKDMERSTHVWSSTKEYSTDVWNTKNTKHWSSKDIEPSTEMRSSKKEHFTDVWYTKDTESSTDVWHSKKEQSSKTGYSTGVWYSKEGEQTRKPLESKTTDGTNGRWWIEETESTRKLWHTSSSPHYPTASHIPSSSQIQFEESSFSKMIPSYSYPTSHSIQPSASTETHGKSIYPSSDSHVPTSSSVGSVYIEGEEDVTKYAEIPTKYNWESSSSKMPYSSDTYRHHSSIYPSSTTESASVAPVTVLMGKNQRTTTLQPTTEPERITKKPKKHPTQPPYKETTDYTNKAPRVRTPIVSAYATSGTIFKFQIPKNTFHDAEDGNTRRLTLDVAFRWEPRRAPSSSNKWLEFDEATQTLVGLPLAEEARQSPMEVTINAIDKGGKLAQDVIMIYVNSSMLDTNPAYEFVMKFEVNGKKFLAERKHLRNLMKKISSFFGDRDPSFITILDARPGSLVLTWTNNSIPTDRCDNETVHEQRRIIFDKNDRINPKFRKYMSPRFTVSSADFNLDGACLALADDLDETETGDVAEVNPWAEAIIPTVIAVAIAIFIVVVILLVCSRKQRQKKNQKEQRNSFEDQDPVMFHSERSNPERGMRSKRAVILPGDVNSKTPGHRSFSPYQASGFGDPDNCSDNEDDEEEEEEHGRYSSYNGSSNPPPPYRLPPPYYQNNGSSYV